MEEAETAEDADRSLVLELLRNNLCIKKGQMYAFKIALVRALVARICQMEMTDGS